MLQKLAKNKVKVSLAKNKLENVFDELNPKFKIYEDKRKRNMVDGEEMLNSEDVDN
jgi:hypothetical protein